MKTKEKAKAYDEALEKANFYHSIGERSNTKEIIENIFPQLRESEDERLRKAIVNHFKNFYGFPKLDVFPIEKIFDYLERQKESAWTEEDENFRKHILPRILYSKGWSMELMDADRERLKEFVERQKIKWLEKQKEYKSLPLDLSIEDVETIKTALRESGLGSTSNRKVYDKLENIPESAYYLSTVGPSKLYSDGTVARHTIGYLEKQKEQKPNFDTHWENGSMICKQKEQNGRDEGCTDFTIYRPIKNGKGKYECIPYSFYGSLTSFSEDKDLINFLRTCFYTKEECNEWIERQKEQNPVEWSEDYREEDIQTRFAFYTYKDEDGVLYLSNVFVEETSRNHGFGTKILAAAEKVAEAIGATSIRLKVKRDNSAHAWYQKHGYNYITFEDEYDWLEKNLEYMKPNKQEWSKEDKEWLSEVYFAIDHSMYSEDERQAMKKYIDSLRSQPKEEWSEEDERMRSRCIRSVECSKQFADSETYKEAKDKEIAWLKSLRPPFKDKEMKLKILKYLSTRCSSLEFEEVEDYLNNLRPSWKPSEEQMKALKRCVDGWTDDGDGTLDSLYNDLKKLM